RYKSHLFNLFLVLFLVPAWANETPVKPFKLNFESVKINPQTVEIVDDKRLGSGKGMTLKAGVPGALNNERGEADLVFKVKVPAAGRFVMRTYAVTDDEGARLMKEAKGKYESLFMKVQIDENRPT